MGNFSGAVDKMVALWLDDDPADKPSDAAHRPGSHPGAGRHGAENLEVGPRRQRPSPRSSRSGWPKGKPIHVTGVKSSSESFASEMKTVEEGKKYDLVVTPLAIDTPGLGVIRIETDCAVSKHRIQQAFAVVRKPTPQIAAKP